MHLICSDCLNQWQGKDSSVTPTCPFCRCDIKGAEKIKIKTKKSPDKEKGGEESIDLQTEISLAEQAQEFSKNLDKVKVHIEPEEPGSVNMAFENELAQPTVPIRSSSNRKTIKITLYNPLTFFCILFFACFFCIQYF